MNLATLAALVRSERENLLSHWRSQVRELPSARHLDTLTLNDHIPGLLDELARALESGSSQTIPEALLESSAPVHGLQRLKDDFDIEEVVAEYNILRGCIHDLANDRGVTLQGEPFHVINRVFDQAIGTALQTYAQQRARDVQERRQAYLAFVAHDLRTPLFAISLAGRVLERMLPQRGHGPESMQMLKALRRSAQQLEGLVKRVLEESTNVETDAGISIERRAFDLWPLVAALIEEIQPLADTAGTRLANQVPDELVVFADAALLKRVLQNLVANAIRYTARGEVVIGARELGAEPAIECWVQDNGSGIPPDLLDRIFDKGETDSAESGGKGLGLAIVQTFTAAHGGKVTVESRQGEGSTFRLTLPLKSDV
ncbi:MAG: HAMP domain-containing histidine kinase [Pseudomonadota bacterium]|nr:HAMP domain-containing histidine kinase [Pseudomonadota bacterium]